MKNIHVLPTDKLSRLYLTTKEYILDEEYSVSTEECSNKILYITNDEVIKEGDWFIGDNASLHKCTLNNAGNINFKGGWYSGSLNCKKVILTTDLDLIKDGVQAIPDEFLEWFTNNPSCDNVEVREELLKLVQNPNYVNHTPDGDGVYLTPKSEDLQYGETIIEEEVIDYKIIIPTETKEEDYLFTTSDGVKVYKGDYFYYISESGRCFENNYALKKYMRDNQITFSTRELGNAYLLSIKPKQETLEEATSKYITNIGYKSDKQYYKFEQLIQFGVKWQKERSYSEEDMRGMYDKSCGLIGLGALQDKTENNERFQALINQFKKR